MGNKLTKRTMIYLPEDLHEGLKVLAFEKKTSIASLIREAVMACWGEDIEDIKDMEKEIKNYRNKKKSDK